MPEYSSRKWHYLVSSPSTLLKREFVKRCYLNLDRFMPGIISQHLIIGRKDNNDIYFKINEWERGLDRVSRDFNSGKLKNKFKQLESYIKSDIVRGQDSIETAKIFWDEKMPGTLYTYFVEDLLSRKLKKAGQNKVLKRKIEKALEQNGNLRQSMAHLAYPLVDRAIKQLSLKNRNVKNFDYCTLPELKGKKKIKPDVEKRLSFYVEIIDKRETKIFTGKKAESYLLSQGFKKEKIDLNLREVSGQPAWGGKVKGQAVIVNSTKDLKKNIKGKVMVSSRTIIEYTPYFKQVKAVVTDCGGINTHAAITAREYKVPCVVGTKIATKIFKDGDWLEVDADAGKIIKK